MAIVTGTEIEELANKYSRDCTRVWEFVRAMTEEEMLVTREKLERLIIHGYV